jgi:hypothetical protein
LSLNFSLIFGEEFSKSSNINSSGTSASSHKRSKSHSKDENLNVVALNSIRNEMKNSSFDAALLSADNSFDLESRSHH